MKLQTKILAVFLPLGLAAGGLLIVVSEGVVHNILMKEVSRQALAEMSELAEEAQEGLQTRNESRILSRLQESQRVVGALYAMALDSAGKVLAHTNVAEQGKVYRDPQTREALESVAPILQELKVQEEKVLEVSQPVWLKTASEDEGDFVFSGSGQTGKKVRLATLRFGIPLKGILQTEMKISRRLVWIILGIGFLMAVFSFFVTRRFLAPVQALAKGTEQISQGEYGVTIPVVSKDELGDLAASFNHMSKVLAKTTVSKEYLDVVLENMLDPLIVLHKEGTLRSLNKAALNLLGYTKPELFGKDAAVLFAASPLEKLKREGFVRNLDAEFLDKSGKKICILFSGATFQDKSDQIAGYICVAKDVTDRKRLENIILQSEKMSAVGQLAAGVAHEINNPLGVILGFAQGLVSRLKAGDPLELPLKSIEREAVRCKNLVQDLLTFSRNTQAERGPMELNSAVEAALSLIQVQAKVKNIDIQKTLVENLPRLLGNKNQLQQVIINLANNAIDAMPQGGTLTFKTELLQENPHSWVCLKVCDTGTGIPGEALPKIFEPFFTTKPVGQGTGLGLSLVYEIVSKHSGKVEVKSRPGNTEFCVKFPARTGQELEKRAKAALKELTGGRPEKT